MQKVHRPRRPFVAVLNNAGLSTFSAMFVCFVGKKVDKAWSWFIHLFNLFSLDLNAASNGGGGGSQRSPSSTYSGPRHQTHPDEEKSGLLLPTNSFGVENPVIVGEASPNVSASVGRTAKLKCKITDLGHKSVSLCQHCTSKVCLLCALGAHRRRSLNDKQGGKRSCWELRQNIHALTWIGSVLRRS